MWWYDETAYDKEGAWMPWKIDLDVFADEAELLARLRRRDRLACTSLLKRFASGLDRLALKAAIAPYLVFGDDGGSGGAQ